jgi:hypothetical protein
MEGVGTERIDVGVREERIVFVVEVDVLLHKRNRGL